MYQALGTEDSVQSSVEIDDENETLANIGAAVRSGGNDSSMKSYV